MDGRNGLNVYLGREDVFAVDDMVQQAICKLYKIDAADKNQKKKSAF
jgi:hypothetical protein